MQPPPPKPRHRLLRWLVGLCVVACVLGAYALGLRWVTHRVESDVQKSFRTLPVSDDDAYKSR